MGDRGFLLSHQFNALERLNGSDQNRSTFGSHRLLQKDSHVFEVEGQCMSLEEIVADHPSEVKAEKVLPRERPIIEARNILFVEWPQGKAMHNVGHGPQHSAAARS